MPQLHPGAAVTTFKNIVDKVVTEYGVAELRGSSVRERTLRLIAIAHPDHRDELTAKARELGYVLSQAFLGRKAAARSSSANASDPRPSVA